MVTISKNSFFFWLILITASADLCADGKGWWSSIKTYFSSFQMPRSFVTFKRPTFNQKWLGVEALAIASGILAYRYFKRPPVKKEGKDTPVKASDLWPPQEIDVFLKNQEAARLKTPIKQDISKTQPLKTETDISKSNQEESLNDTNLDRLLDEATKEIRANHQKKFLDNDDGDLNAILDQADEELLKTEKTLLTSLKIGDVVKIINDSSIDIATSDKTLYNNLQKKQGKDEIHNFKKILAAKFLNRIGIIREKNLTHITVEIDKKNSNNISCSLYLTILPKDVKKITLLLNPYNKIKIDDWVKFSLKKEFFKAHFNQDAKLKDSYNETFDNQTHYIGKIFNINQKNKTVDVIHTFHFRDYVIQQTLLQFNIKNVSLIQDPEMLN